MATRTSVGTGNWSAAGTWDTGIPADGDDVVIASGHVVTFDVDQSAFVTGVKVTITGTLNHATTGGPYTLFLKTGNALVGTGTWNVGTALTPIPFAVKHTITGAAGWNIQGGAGFAMNVYGTEPTNKYIALSGEEAIGQTEISVGTDVTGDIWAAGDSVYIAETKTKEGEFYIIADGGIAAGTITLTGGLSAAKLSGAYLVLVSRNVKFVSAGTMLYGTFSVVNIGSAQFVNNNPSGRIFYATAPTNGFNISGGVFGTTVNNTQTGFGSISNLNISGGIYLNWLGQMINYGVNNIISGGLFIGNGVAVYGSGFVISDGLFIGNTTVLSGYGNAISGGTFTGNREVLYQTYFTKISGGTFSGNTYDIRDSVIDAFNVTFGSATEFYQYVNPPYPHLCSQSINHDGNDGALKSWSKGGIVTSQTGVKPDGYTQAYQHALESASYPCMWYKRFSVEPGKTVTATVQLRKSGSMTYLPKVYLVRVNQNPIAGDTPVDSFTMTDSTDTWETDTFTVTNSTNYDQEYELWFVGKNATGNMYSAYQITTSGGGGGAVKILPITGKVGL